MSLTKFTPNNKGKFSTRGGKRIFPPEWYAAQAARRKRNKDGSYKKGQFKTSRIEEDKPKQKKEFPNEWKERQAQRALERKQAQEEGTYIRKVRGKRREYQDKDIPDVYKGKREVICSDSDVGSIYNQLYRGDKAKIIVNDAHEVVSILGFGVVPGTKKGVNKRGRIFTVDTNNLVSAWL